MRLRGLCGVFAGLVLLQTCAAFYLPGVAPQDYARVSSRRLSGCSGLSNLPAAAGIETDAVSCQEDREVIKVNKLTSIKTQLPYEYYSIPYCKPEVVKSSAENLGEVLRGDRIENSLYEVCNPACSLATDPDLNQAG